VWGTWQGEQSNQRVMLLNSWIEHLDDLTIVSSMLAPQQHR
jgi:hypothetical protein